MTEVATPSLPADTAPSPTLFAGLTAAQLVLVVGWPMLLLSALYGFFLPQRDDMAMLEAAIRTRPAVKVVDVTAVMRAHIAQGMTADQAILAANANFQQLAKAGYLVIDNNAVLAAPATTELQP